MDLHCPNDSEAPGGSRKVVIHGLPATITNGYLGSLFSRAGFPARSIARLYAPSRVVVTLPSAWDAQQAAKELDQTELHGRAVKMLVWEGDSEDDTPARVSRKHSVRAYSLREYDDEAPRKPDRGRARDDSSRPSAITTSVLAGFRIPKRSAREMRGRTLERNQHAESRSPSLTENHSRCPSPSDTAKYHENTDAWGSEPGVWDSELNARKPEPKSERDEWHADSSLYETQPAHLELHSTVTSTLKAPFSTGTPSPEKDYGPVAAILVEAAWTYNLWKTADDAENKMQAQHEEREKKFEKYPAFEGRYNRLLDQAKAETASKLAVWEEKRKESAELQPFIPAVVLEVAQAYTTLQSAKEGVSNVEGRVMNIPGIGALEDVEPKLEDTTDAWVGTCGVGVLEDAELKLANATSTWAGISNQLEVALGGNLAGDLEASPTPGEPGDGKLPTLNANEGRYEAQLKGV